MNQQSKVSKQELVRDLALRMHVSPGQAHKVLEQVCESVRGFLKAGAAVEFGDLFTMSVSGHAEIRADESGGFSAYAPSQRNIETEPIGALKEDLDRAAQSAIYYVALNNSQFRGLLADHFGRRGWQLVHTRNGMEASNKLKHQPPVALIFEAETEGWQELVRELKCDPATNWIPIVGVFPAEAKDQPVASLTVQPDEIIYEPFDFGDFIRTAGSELAARVTMPHGETAELEIQLSGSQTDRRTAREMVEEILFRKGLPEEFARDVGAALSEALDNAVRHGHQMVECCTIVMRMLLDPKRITLAVRDTGPGFDYATTLTTAKTRLKRGNDKDAKLAKAVDALRTSRTEGDPDGLCRMLELVDCVDFNAQGNEIMLSKRRPEPKAEAKPKRKRRRRRKPGTKTPTKSTT